MVAAGSPSVDAIVVSFNTADLLRACLTSLLALEYPLRRIYVVDNASQDASERMVKAEFPSVELIEAGENLGFARANNLAFDRSDAEFVLLLNSDAEIESDALTIMMAEMEQGPDIGIVGPMLLNADGTVQFEGARNNPSILGEFGNITHLNVRMPGSVLGRYLINDWDHRSSRDVEAVCGACMLVRVKALEGQPLFRDDFFMYGEDVDICQRVRTAGWRIGYVAEARVLHHGGASSSKAKTRMRFAGVISMAQLLSRSHGPLYAAAYVATVPFAWPIGVLVKKVWRR